MLEEWECEISFLNNQWQPGILTLRTERLEDFAIRYGTILVSPDEENGTWIERPAHVNVVKVRFERGVSIAYVMDFQQLATGYQIFVVLYDVNRPKNIS